MIFTIKACKNFQSVEFIVDDAEVPPEEIDRAIDFAIYTCDVLDANLPQAQKGAQRVERKPAQRVERKPAQMEVELATEKQKEFMQRVGIRFSEATTKTEACEKIKTYKETH